MKRYKKKHYRAPKRWHDNHDKTPFDLEDLPSISGFNPNFTPSSPLFGPIFDQGEDGAA